MRVILMVNWGLGLEIVKTIQQWKEVAIAAVITQHKECPKDRWQNAVWDLANRQGYQTVDQESIDFSDLAEQIHRQKIDLLVCHAFMRILPWEVFSAPTHGSINVHPSLLPKYRGPSPTYWVLHNRESVTGLTCHYIDNRVDTGDIIHQIEIPVKSGDTIASIIERQKTVVAELLVESFSKIHDQNFRPLPQQDRLASYAPRPERQRID